MVEVCVYTYDKSYEYGQVGKTRFVGGENCVISGRGEQWSGGEEVTG